MNFDQSADEKYNRIDDLVDGNQVNATSSNVLNDQLNGIDPLNGHSTPNDQLNPMNGNLMNEKNSSQIEQVNEKCRNVKRDDYLIWEDYFMSVALLSAKRSKDPSTQVGACIVNNDNKIVSIGYNGMPINCNDDLLPWGKNSKNELENKYL